MNQVWTRIPGLALIALGVISGWFALFGDYWLLMNPRFKWLTAAGALVIVVLGVAATVSGKVRASKSSLALFLLFALIVVTGRPYSKSTNASITPIRPESDNELVQHIVPKFKVIDLISLHAATRKKGFKAPDELFVTFGWIKRTPELDQQGYVALVKPLLYCCLADAMVIGFRLSAKGDREIPSGWVAVLGRIKRAESPMRSPNMRLGAARFSIIAVNHFIEPVSIAPLVRRLPSMADELPEDKFAMFWKVIRASGLEGMLKNNGPITLFVPVDQGFDSLPAAVLNNMSKPENRAYLRRLIENHVVPKRLWKRDLFERKHVTTKTKRELSVRTENGVVAVENSRIVFADIQTANGIIHVIFPAILPKEVEDGQESKPSQ